MKLIFLSLLLFFPLSCHKSHLLHEDLRVILDSKPSSLDPRKAVDANGMRMTALIFQSLVKRGKEGEILLDAAKSWRLEGLSYHFELKEGISFSNGRRLKKEDLEFSFKEFKKKGSLFHSAFKNIKSVEVLKKGSSFSVQITLKDFQAPFLLSDLPVIKILPRQEILQDTEAFLKKPFGTGEYEIESLVFRQIVLKKRKIEEKKPRRIVFQIIRDGMTRYQKMMSKESDIAPSVLPLRKISRFERGEGFQVVSRPGMSTTYLLLNLKNEILKKKKLRQALSLSLNREEVIKYKMYGYAKVASSYMRPGSFFYSLLNPSLFDINKAKALILSLGLKGAKLTLSTSNNQDSVSKARVLISQMRKTGLEFELESMEWGAFYKDVGKGAYDLALMKWTGVSDPDIYRLAFHSENLAPAGRNRSFYVNKTLDQLLDLGLKERDRKKRKRIYEEVEKILFSNFIVLPLWHDKEVSVVSSQITNYEIWANGSFDNLPLVIKDKNEKN